MFVMRLVGCFVGGIVEYLFVRWWLLGLTVAFILWFRIVFT